MSKLNDAIADAVNASLDGKAPEGEEESTADKVEATTPPKEETPGSTEVSEEVDTEPAGDVPSELFGVDLSRLPDEDRAVFIREWTEQNKTISRLQREKAAASKNEEAPPAKETEPDVSQFSDEEIATALGLDPEDLDAPGVRASIALARGYAELRGQVATVVETTKAAETRTTWDSKLAELEGRYGELPVSHEQLQEWAKGEGVSDPEAAYWKAVGPIRFEVREMLDKRMKDVRTAGKKSATTPRPTSSTPTTDAPLTSKDAKSAVAEAFRRAAQEKGFVFND